MPFTLTMPKLSPTMEEGTIVKWHKKEGDQVNEGEVLFEVATDKATVEHSAIDGGFLRKVLVAEGSDARVNQAIAVFSETADEDISSYEPEGKEPMQEEVPVAAGAEQKEESAAPTPQPTAGLAQPAFVPEPPLEKYEFPRAATGALKASPLARKLAQEKGVDLSTVKGSGPGGRVVSRDLDLAQPDLPVTFGRTAQPTKIPGSYTEQSMSPMRKVIGRRLQESKTFIPHFYVVQETRADRIWDLSKQLKAVGLKISFNDFVMRACALALKEHPEVNTGFNSVSQSVVQFETIDIAVAVSVDGGLITPIVRHADYKTIAEISSEVKSLAKRARDGKLDREEYSGGSFTVSNLGMYGVTEFTAVINPPQSAILAVGGIEEKPVVQDGKIEIGRTMKITLSVDHRVIDGAVAAQFIKTVQKYLENPAVLLV